MAEDTFSMRQDAVRRMREMYARSRPQPQARQQQADTPRETPQDFSPDPPPESGAAEKSPEKEKSPDLFETFFKDKEKMLILALLVILSQENTDNSLLFALMFLLM